MSSVYEENVINPQLLPIQASASVSDALSILAGPTARELSSTTDFVASSVTRSESEDGTITEYDTSYASHFGALHSALEPATKEKTSEKYICRSTEDPEEIHAARKLVAERYLHLGFITSDQVDATGVMNQDIDPYHTHATYYLLTEAGSERIVATARRIHYDNYAGEKSFPLWEHKDELDPEYVRKIEEAGISRCVEISSLVRNPEFKPDKEITMQLYRKMFQDAWAAGGAGEKLFLMACKPNLFKKFRVLFDGSMKRIGEDLDYPGETVVPAMFELDEGSVGLIQKAAEPLLRNPHGLIHRRVVRYMLDGADVSLLSPSITKALSENGFNDVLGRGVVSDLRNGFLKTFFNERKPEMAAAAGLIGYTALRTVGVATGISPNTNVDWRVFLGIELATTPTYILGMGDMIRSAVKPDDYNRWQRLKAIGLGGGSFIAPYAYVAAEGHNMPAGAWAGVGAFATVSAISFLRKLRGARNKITVSTATDS